MSQSETDKLLSVMEALRDPETGCPWDKKQTFETIIPLTIEETYEVADAILRNDLEDLQEELGDLLFHIVYHAQMAKELGVFDFKDVADCVTKKMIRRHPHVFSDEKAHDEADVSRIWKEQKRTEKQEKTLRGQDEGFSSILDDIPVTFPALPRSQKISKKAADLGFEWAEPSQVLDKMEEEIDEMRDALRNSDRKNMKEEIGDMFFTLTNFARILDIDAESALRDANAKFTRRFRGMEKDIQKGDRNWSDLSLEEMENIWKHQKAKAGS